MMNPDQNWQDPESFAQFRPNQPQGVTPELPVLPTAPRPRPPRPQPPRPQPPRPPIPPRPIPPNRPSGPVFPPHGVTPQVPVLPGAPRPPRPTRPFSLPFGFPLLAQARSGIVFTSFGRIPMHSLPIPLSPVIDVIPHNSFVWVLGERDGWAAVNYNGRVGFVDSRFVILL